MKLTDAWQRNFLRLELLLCLALTVGISFIGERFLSPEAIMAIEERSVTIHATGTTLFGALLGFAVTTLSIVAALSAHPRMKIVRESAHYDQIWHVFRATILALAGATAVAFLGLAFAIASISYLAVSIFFALLVSFRLARAVWILENVLKITSN